MFAEPLVSKLTAVALDEHCLVYPLWVPTPEVVRLQAFVDMSEGIGTTRTPKGQAITSATSLNNYTFMTIYTTPSQAKSLISLLHSIQSDISWKSVTLELLGEKAWEELESFIKVEVT